MLVRVDVLTRNNVTISDQADRQPMVFAHGYGCDQNMWRFVAPAFEDRYRQHGPARDDIAVVVVKVPPPGQS